jgi:hypothetical protein
MGRIGVTELLILLVVAIPALLLYFLPTILAFSRKKANKGIIFLVNFFFGWSLIGWVASLIWALSTDNSQTIIVNNNPANLEEKVPVNKESTYDDKLNNLQRLKDLFDSGVLTEMEFEEQKSKILSS